MSTFINLLPWRERLWQRRLRLWLALLFLGCAVSQGVAFYQALQQCIAVNQRALLFHQQQQLQQQLQQRAQRLQQLQKAGQIRQQHWQNWQRQQQHMQARWRMLAQLPQWLPGTLWLTQLHMDSHQLTFSGFSWQATDPAALVAILASDSRLENVQSKNREQAGPPPHAFTLQASFREAVK